MLPTSKIQAIGLLAAVAALGFAPGAFTRSGVAAPVPTDWRERCSYSGMLSDRLGLNATQRDSIRTLMRSQRPAMRALMAPMQPQMDSLVAHERDERSRADSGRAAPGGR